MYDAKTNPRGRRPAAFFLAILLALSLSLGVGVSMTERAVRQGTARAGDVILLCGKGHETYEIDRTGRHPFDERAVVREALRSRGEE